MEVQNSEIAQTFNQVADLLEIEGANPFRIRAYRNAARTLLDLSESVSDIVHEKGDLTSLPGIGKDLASKIEEIVDTGHLSLLDQVEKETPAVLRDLLKLPLLGPKRVQLLYKAFGIQSLQDLQEIVENKRILQLKGFGEKIRIGILEELKRKQSQDRPRLKLSEAEEAVQLLLKHLRKAAGVQQLVVAGSFRRRQETVGDIDILITSKDSEAVTKHFLEFEGISKVISHGSTRTAVVLRSGVQVDLRVVEDISYGAALLYFTGSKAHNIALRKIALKRGLKINEYGIFRDKEMLASRSEEDIYRALNLPYIEPELRENRGEVEAALNGKLPKLVNLQDIRGDLHVHSVATDGVNTIRDLALAGKELGYSYIAITDHSKRMTVAKGLDEKRLLQQIEEINHLNQQMKGFTILKSIEVDILEDGRLDLPDEVLAQLDLTVCAVHSHFQLSREKQTQRILRAMENRYFGILAHPTGRLIGEREAYNIDLEKIIMAAKNLHRIFEINCQPERMDLSDMYCRMVKESGAKVAISTDAHSTAQLGFMHFGVGQARRGWLENEDVINTLPIENLKKLLKGLR